jgi:hypothetical protein
MILAVAKTFFNSSLSKEKYRKKNKGKKGDKEKRKKRK